MKVLVTGASGGIGSALVDLLLEDGHEIIACSRVNTFKQKNNFKGSIRWINVDLSNLHEIEKFTNEPKNVLTDIFVHCAGVANSGRMGRLNTKELVDMFVLNTIAPMLILNRALPDMIENQFGRIVLVGSIVGDAGGFGLTGYSASKSALVGLNKSLNREIHEIKEKNPKIDITTNLVKPGFTDSNMTQSMKYELKEKIRINSTLKRFLYCEEVAHEINRLIQPSASYISGSTIEVNGGQIV